MQQGECRYGDRCHWSHLFWRRHEVMTAPTSSRHAEPVRTCTVIEKLNCIAYSDGKKLKVRRWS